MFAIVITTMLFMLTSRVKATEYMDSVPPVNDNNYHKVELRSFQVCGEKLVTALNLICGIKGYNEPAIKRDFVYKFGKSDKSALRKLYQNLENEYLIRMLEKKLNLNTQTSSSNNNRDLDTYSLDSTDNDYFTRNTRGVVEECCHRPCTTRTLKAYCKE